MRYVAHIHAKPQTKTVTRRSSPFKFMTVMQELKVLSNYHLQVHARYDLDLAHGRTHKEWATA